MQQTNTFLPLLALTTTLAACGGSSNDPSPSPSADGGTSIEVVEGEPGIEATLDDGRIAVQLAPCPEGEVLKSTGDGYACAEDLAGEGLPACPEDEILKSTGDGYECAEAATSEGLPACPEGEILKSTGDGYECAEDDDTETDPAYEPAEGGGLELADDELRLEVCPEGQVLKSTGDEYECAETAEQ